MAEALLIHGFQKARPKGFVHLNGGTHDLSRQVCAWASPNLCVSVPLWWNHRFALNTIIAKRGSVAALRIFLGLLRVRQSHSR